MRCVALLFSFGWCDLSCLRWLHADFVGLLRLRYCWVYVFFGLSGNLLLDDDLVGVCVDMCWLVCFVAGEAAYVVDYLWVDCLGVGLLWLGVGFGTWMFCRVQWGL